MGFCRFSCRSIHRFYSATHIQLEGCCNSHRIKLREQAHIDNEGDPIIYDKKFKSKEYFEIYNSIWTSIIVILT